MTRTIISLCQSKKTMLAISRMTCAQRQIERSHLSIHNFLHPALWMLLHRQRECVLAASQLKCNFIVVAYLIFRRLCKNLHSCVPMPKNNWTKLHKTSQKKQMCCIWQCFYSLFLSRVATYYVWGGRSTLSSGFIQIQWWYFRSAWSSGLIQTQYQFFKSTPSPWFLQIQFPYSRSIMHIALFLYKYNTNTLGVLHHLVLFVGDLRLCFHRGSINHFHPRPGNACNV